MGPGINDRAIFRPRARSAGGAIVNSPARSEAKCRDTGTKSKSPGGTIERAIVPPMRLAFSICCRVPHVFRSWPLNLRVPHPRRFCEGGDFLSCPTNGPSSLQLLASRPERGAPPLQGGIRSSHSNPRSAHLSRRFTRASLPHATLMAADRPSSTGPDFSLRIAFDGSILFRLSTGVDLCPIVAAAAPSLIPHRAR